MWKSASTARGEPAVLLVFTSQSPHSGGLCSHGLRSCLVQIPHRICTLGKSGRRKAGEALELELEALV